MDSLEKGVLKNLKDSNKQAQMATRDYPIQDLKVDWKVAAYIYRFLKGMDTRLPSYNFLDEVSNAIYIDGVISVGYGIVVNKKNGDIIISHSEPITDITERIDEISSDSYKVYTANDLGVRDIDPNEMPIFDSRRIEVLQQYLREYKNKDLNEEKEEEEKKIASSL